MKPSVYTRPAKPLRIPVRRRADFEPVGAREVPEIVAVDKATECHVTPPEVARRMVRYLGPVGDFLTLEPSAGTGNLVRALLDSGHSRYELCTVERHHALVEQCARAGLGVPIQRCFLEWAEEVRGKVEFPRVLMNPPFREVGKHVAAARSLLGRGGHDGPPVLVALVPVTFEREPGAEVLEYLDETTFATARVRTKIIRFLGN